MVLLGFVLSYYPTSLVIAPLSHSLLVLPLRFSSFHHLPFVTAGLSLVCLSLLLLLLKFPPLLLDSPALLLLLAHPHPSPIISELRVMKRGLYNLPRLLFLSSLSCVLK